MATLRVALCQLECHPAIFAGNVNYLNEPFVPGLGKPSLSLLTTRGLDVASLEALCREQYLTWHDARVAVVLEFLRGLDPPPDVVLFPECSVPIELLRRMVDWSALTGTTVLAGSHAPRRSPKMVARYVSAGLEKDAVNRLFRYGSTNTLPFIRAGEVTLVPKRLLSPFERSIVSATSKELPRVRPFDLPSGSLRLLPLICAEALQLYSVSETYDLVGVIAYDSKPQQFRKYIDLQIANGKPVAICNDGAVGQSFVHTILDQRIPNWLAERMPSGLPPGDAVLVVDLNLDVTAVEVGTASPRQPLQLVALASVVAEQSPAAEVSARLKQIGTRSEPGAMEQQLSSLLSASGIDPLQRLRIDYLRYLEAEGFASDGWWAALGVDCIIPGRPSIRQLEATLAATCSTELSKWFSSPLAQQSDTATALIAYLAECDRRKGLAAAASARPLEVPAEQRTAVLDRDGETREVHQFLDDPSFAVLEISGLQQIGKSSILAKALAESGIQRILRISVTETSSAEYIAHAILQTGVGVESPRYEDPVAVMKGSAVAERLKAIQVVVIEKAHLLLNRGLWRDEFVPRILEALVFAAGQAKCKLIVETRRQLSPFIDNPAIRKPLRVYGLDRARIQYGVSLFDAQLRRVGLSPSVIGADDKAFIVSKLGGHPVAIALAADTAFETGCSSLKQSLRAHQGFFLNFVARLVRALDLADQDRELLQLLCLARTGLPREALLRSVDFPAGDRLRDLIAIGTVDVSPDDLIEVAGVLRQYFDTEALSEAQRRAFHRVAAEAYTAFVDARPDALFAAIEAEFHAGVIGASVPSRSATQLVDGALASAFRLFNSGEYDKAAEIVTRLLARRRTADMLRLAAKIEAHRNNFNAALDYARHAFSRNPQDTKLLADLAKIALNQYRDDVAESMVSIARAAGVEAVSVLIVEGRMWVRRGRFHEAAAAFRRAIELTSNNPWPFYFLGAANMQAGRIDDTIDILRDGEQFYYDSQCRNRRALMAIRTKLAIAYLLKGEYETAGPIIQALVEEDPDNPEVVRAQGALIIAREGIQQTSKALELLTKARVRGRRDRAQLHLFAGSFHLAIDDRLGAAEEFRRGLEADPGNVLIMMRLARTLFELASVAWRNADDTYKAHLDECRSVTRRILRFDRDNAEGIALVEDVARVFNVDV